MTNAAGRSYYSDDDEGVAAGAARLGPDGGPAVRPRQRAPAIADDLDDIMDDEAWLEEGLSDEELAALGEEDFDLEDLDDIDPEVEAAYNESFTDEYEDDADNFEYHPDETVDADDFDVVDEYQEDVYEEETYEQPVEQPSARAVVAGGAYGDELTDLGDDEVDHRPVPRIAIHAFCESPTVTNLLEKASVDRRLSKAHLTIHMGGIAKAVDQFQSSTTPNLIILETLATGTEIFAQLNELAEVCDPSTKVVIIGQANDIILYRELIRQGVSEYIVRPRSPLQIIKTIADLYIDPSASPIGRTVAFVGARGGVGASTLAHNVGWCTAEEFKSDTVILDLDLPFGTASLDFDQDASAGLVEALTSPERLDAVLLDRLLQKHTEHLSLFTAPSVLDRDYDLDDQAFETVLDVLRSSAPTIIVDVPHMWCSWSKRVLTTADEIVITAAPDLASFRNAKQLADIIGAARPNDSEPNLVINMYDAKQSPVQPDQFAEHVGLVPEKVFEWDPKLFITAATNASPLMDVAPNSKTVQQIRELSAKVLGRPEVSLTKSRFDFMSLFSKK